MQLVERLWKTLTTFLGVSSLDQALHPADQIPLAIPDRVIQNEQHNKPHPTGGHGPIFKPPGGLPDGDGSEFKCNYTAMKGFRFCSTAKDRGCWLTNGKETWDIYTDYEATNETAPTPVNIMPTGITRTYYITATPSAINADGLSFPHGKVFKPKDGEPSYPGPWIQACWGDTIVVNVTNHLDKNGTSIHWHGIRQWRTMHMDGVNGITQCAIAPKDSFNYTFKASQYGSSWYHAHYSIQYADGLVGPITIHGPHSAAYDVAPDIPILLTDWAHNSAFEFLVTGNMTYPGILLNGQGNISAMYNETVPGVNSSLAHPYVLNITTTKNQKHLLRIINTSFETTFVFSVDGHVMTPVQADFVPIYPYAKPSTNITVGIGQRYEVILEASNKSDPATSYWIRTYIPHGCGIGINPSAKNYSQVGILWYSSPYETEAPTPISTPYANLSAQPCADEPYASMTPVVPYQIPFIPANNQTHGEEERILWDKTPAELNYTYPNYTEAGLALNPLNLKPPYNPFRIDMSNPSFLNLNQTRPWQPSEVVIPEEFNSTVWIQLTITNYGAFGPHPMHLHGHDFAILNVSYNRTSKDQTTQLNLNNPPRRDVVLVPTNGSVTIAFKADNPGTWLMHCHIARHAAEGLGLQILERRKDAINIWPSPDGSPALNETVRVCNKWREWQGNCTNWADNCTSIFQDDSGI